MLFPPFGKWYGTGQALNGNHDIADYVHVPVGAA